jgi:RhtB (resistance to homoserine/threonine) family protein
MEQYYFFIVMSILLIILPGPDTGLATKNTITYGKKGGLKTVLGITCGLIIHTFAAVVGLSAIIVKSAVLFSAFKYIGAIYLIYLGVMSLWSLRKKEVPFENNDQGEIKYGTSCFRQGFLTNLLNPKVAVFFLTFLPQFVVPEGNLFLQLLGMGVIYTCLTFIWFLLYVYLINYISTWMKKPSTQLVIQGLTGCVLVGFGIKLALEKNP